MTKINLEKDNFLDSLKGDVDIIRENRADLDGLAHQLDEVVNWCIDRHDKTLTKLLEMERFLERNIDLFWRPNEKLTERLPSNTSYGYMNPRNKVLVCRYGSKGIVKVWMDNGIVFWWNEFTKRAVYIGHNMEERRCGPGNHDGQYYVYNNFEAFVDDNYPSEGYERFFMQPTSLNIDMDKTGDFEYVKHLKETVEQDWENALRACQCLVDAVMDIRARELDYYYNMEDMVDSTKPKKGTK